MKQMPKQAGQGAEQPDISVLTERQRMAYTLRQQGLTYAKVGEAMGISSSGAERNIKAAERRLRECAAYHAWQKRNDEPAELPLTRGELRLVLRGLQMVEKEIGKSVNAWNCRTGWKGRLPYEARILAGVLRRAHTTLYGTPPKEDFLE